MAWPGTAAGSLPPVRPGRAECQGVAYRRRSGYARLAGVCRHACSPGIFDLHRSTAARTGPGLPGPDRYRRPAGSQRILLAYLDLIDIAVQPAANEYCCPMKILEYMALGKPIVAPRQENIQDLLREGESV